MFAGLVAELSGPKMTVLVVEDLHWADDATLDALGFLARRIDDLPALVPSWPACGCERHPAAINRASRRNVSIARARVGPRLPFGMPNRRDRAA